MFPLAPERPLVKAYLISLGVGVLVGVLYGMLRVRSPAPPVIALLGLAGMLAGEQLVTGLRVILSKGGIT